MKYTNRGEIVIEQRKLVNKLTKKGYPIVRIQPESGETNIKRNISSNLRQNYEKN